ncbi:MAG TPA: hypothetical protein VHN99_01585, partial [Deinococcales bacterium]|nr:hypothetical protein [Deinococcales bacterium]
LDETRALDRQRQSEEARGAAEQRRLERAAAFRRAEAERRAALAREEAERQRLEALRPQAAERLLSIFARRRARKASAAFFRRCPACGQDRREPLPPVLLRAVKAGQLGSAQDLALLDPAGLVAALVYLDRDERHCRSRFDGTPAGRLPWLAFSTAELVGNPDALVARAFGNLPPVSCACGNKRG